MFRKFILSLIAFAPLLLCVTPSSAAADDTDACDHATGDPSIAACTRLLQRNPNDANAYINRGARYRAKGEPDRALADYDQAIRLDPKNANAYYNRAIAYGSKGLRERAIADYGEAMRLNPGDPDAPYNRGAEYEERGDYRRALADYERSLKIDPKHALARKGRERVQAALAPRPNPAPLPPAQAPVQTAALPPAAPPVVAERRVALVIGNSGYASNLVSALPNPRRDAQLVANALRQTGFDTTELTDLDHAGMVKALQSFRAKADSADWALVYFAGHGIEVNRVNYLLPVDAKLADSRDVKHETVSYEDLAEAISGARALRIVILDACRNNPFKAQMRQSTALRGSLERGLAAPPEPEPGTLVVYAAKEGESAIDGEGENSPFARAFVARLRTPGREVQRVFDDVRDDVLKTTDRRQQPYKYGSLPGGRDFFFIAGK